MPRTTDPRLARTRAKVLAAANEVLRERGFADVTIDHISARSSVARSTIYRHWKTKDEILRDAFSAIALPATDDAQLALREALLRWVSTFAAGLQHNWGRAAATLAASALDDPSQRAIVNTFRDGYRADIATLVRRAAHQGEGVADDPADIADQLVAPLFYRYLISDQPLDPAFLRAHTYRVHERLSRADQN